MAFQHWLLSSLSPSLPACLSSPLPFPPPSPVPISPLPSQKIGLQWSGALPACNSLSQAATQQEQDQCFYNVASVIVCRRSNLSAKLVTGDVICRKAINL